MIHLKKLTIKKVYQNISGLKSLHSNFFKKIQSKKYEINVANFNNLNETLKFFCYSIFLSKSKYSSKKDIKEENISNIIDIIRNSKRNFNENQYFLAKIYNFEKKYT